MRKLIPILATLALGACATTSGNKATEVAIACNQPKQPPSAGVLWGGPSQGFDNRAAWRMICDDVKAQPGEGAAQESVSSAGN